MIKVFAVSLPGCNKEYFFDGDTVTVAQVLEQAEITLDAQSEVKVNGDIANIARVLHGDEQIIVSKKVKGN